MISPRNIFLLAVGAVALIGLSVAGTLALTTTSTQKPSVPSDGPLYLFDAELASAEDGKPREWNQMTSGSMSSTDAMAPVVCSADSTRIATFIAAPGDERTPTAWGTWEFLGVLQGVQKSSLSPLAPGRMTSGQGPSIRAAGGTYSLGVACTTNNNIEVTSAYYRTVSIKAGGEWTVAPLP